MIASRRVFFMLGSQKSGTTWVQRLLDAHPAVACGGEGHLLDLLAPILEIAVGEYNNSPKVTVPLETEGLFAATRLLADGLLATYLHRSADPDNVRAVGDKTPETALSLVGVKRVYPGAKLLHVIRDGRDGAVSGWAHLKRQGEDGCFASFAEYAEYFARRHWVGYVSAARRDAVHWQDDYHEVRYEDLHDRPQETLRRILDFLEIEHDADAVDRCVRCASFEALSGGRRRGDEDTRSHYRKGVVGDWRNQFDAEARARFEAVAGSLLRELGYAQEPAVTSA
ncbi:MAG: sulfotransferase [Planctomycetes bacterium]|nr:sulfotransferase [Planctomycetota bacterium]